MRQYSISNFADSCGRTALDMPGSREMTEQTDRRKKAAISSSLVLGRPEVMTSLRHYPLAHSQGHNRINTQGS